MPDTAPDLSRFQVEQIEGEPARIRLGTLIPGGHRRIRQKPLPSWSSLNGPREEVWIRTTLKGALEQPEGTIVNFDAIVVLVDGETPRVCSHEDYVRGCCPSGSPRLYDVDGSALVQHTRPRYTAYTAGLLRRYRDGFVQYIVGADLEFSSSFAAGDLYVDPPPDFAQWSTSEPLRVPPCEWKSNLPE